MDRDQDRAGARGKSGPEGELDVWARCVALGISDDLYWNCTPTELDALITAYTDRDRRRHEFDRELAGLVAATIINQNPYRAKTAQAVQPMDFWPAPKSTPQRTVSPSEMQQHLLLWADKLNSRFKRHRA